MDPARYRDVYTCMVYCSVHTTPLCVHMTPLCACDAFVYAQVEEVVTEQQAFELEVHIYVDVLF